MIWDISKEVEGVRPYCTKDAMFLCGDCGHPYGVHGWIEKGLTGQVVCPGDFIEHDDEGPHAIKRHLQ